MGSAAIALAVANTFLGDAYRQALHTRVAGLDLLHWINDGLMAVFFLLVGLEIKREMAEGRARQLAAPRCFRLIAALGGMPCRRDLHGCQLPAVRQTARLGDADRDRHCLRAWRAGAARLARAGLAQGVPYFARHHRRSRRNPHHRDFLRRQSVLFGTRRRCGVRRHALLAQLARRDAASPLHLPRVHAVGGDAVLRHPCDACRRDRSP